MPTLVFDVNETLLDLAGLDRPFADVFGSRGAEVKRLWFARLLHQSTVMSTLGTYQDFGVIARAALADLADALRLPASAAQVQAIVATMGSLPAHTDVVEGLTELQAAGHRLVALTNSGQLTADAQLASAGLADAFAQILSVDVTLRFKPHPAVYAHAADAVGEQPSSLVLVAAHDWDCAGAMKAGWRAGFLARPGQSYSPLLQPPTWRAGDLVELVATMAAEL